MRPRRRRGEPPACVVVAAGVDVAAAGAVAALTTPPSVRVSSSSSLMLLLLMMMMMMLMLSGLGVPVGEPLAGQVHALAVATAPRRGCVVLQAVPNHDEDHSCRGPQQQPPQEHPAPREARTRCIEARMTGAEEGWPASWPTSGRRSCCSFFFCRGKHTYTHITYIHPHNPPTRRPFLRVASIHSLRHHLA
jgi:hypothetical protein